MRLIGVLFTKPKKQHRTDSIPPSCRRSESGDGRLKAAAAAITVFVSL